MIFAIWALLWVANSTVFVMFLVPLVAVLIRSSFLDRPFRKLLFPFGAAVLLLGYLIALGDSVRDAALMSGRVLVSSIILVHVAYGFDELSSSLFGARLGTLFLLTQRSFALVAARLEDVGYSFKVQWRASSRLRKSRIRLVLGLLVTGTKELLSLWTEFDRLMRSRGNLPVTEGWTVPPKRRMFLFLGDVALFGLAVAPILMVAEELVPSPIRALF